MAVPFRPVVFFLPLLLVANGAVAFGWFPFFNNQFEIPDPPEENQFNGISNQNTQRQDYETEYMGGWEMASLNSGVSAMHVQLMPETDKVVMLDATNLGPSQLPLPKGNCRPDPTGKGRPDDCWAHALEFDSYTSEIRPLKVLTNPWCSSGALSVNGTLVQTGGWNDGGQGVRYLTSCPTCDWLEYPKALSVQRWYASQHILPDGRFIVVGGRRQFSYEYVPEPGKSNPTNYKLPLLFETTDDVENNLYPFVYLSTDGNVFILANNRSILLDPKTNKVVREFPVLPGGSRNYPASAMSVLLPINIKGERPNAEVLVCGGTKSDAPRLAAKGIFYRAVRHCGRITITKPDATWHNEIMPTERVMGDMLLLPNAEVLLINGAKRGSAGWGFATEPNFEPLIYNPTKPRTQRFRSLQPSTIPRMYHSTSAVLPDGKILVAGSNPNNAYVFEGVDYPTELRVEKFYPPYLDPALDLHRPMILKVSPGNLLPYRAPFTVQISLNEFIMEISNIKLTMLFPPFTTHGYSMSQRMIILRTQDFRLVGIRTYEIVSETPATAEIAPPGYYMLFVNNRGVPGKGWWIRIE